MVGRSHGSSVCRGLLSHQLLICAACSSLISLFNAPFCPPPDKRTRAYTHSPFLHCWSEYAAGLRTIQLSSFEFITAACYLRIGLFPPLTELWHVALTTARVWRRNSDSPVFGYEVSLSAALGLRPTCHTQTSLSTLFMDAHRPLLSWLRFMWRSWPWRWELNWCDWSSWSWCLVLCWLTVAVLWNSFYENVVVSISNLSFSSYTGLLWWSRWSNTVELCLCAGDKPTHLPVYYPVTGNELRLTLKFCLAGVLNGDLLLRTKESTVSCFSKKSW